MFAREAPVSSLFGSDDSNVLTFAVSDALNTVVVGAGDPRGRRDASATRSRSSASRTRACPRDSAKLRLDRRRVPYWTALRGVSDWWAAQPGYAPAACRSRRGCPSTRPGTTTTRALDAAVLLKEVAIAKKMGFDVHHRRRRLADPGHRPRLRLHGRLGARAHPGHERLRRRLPRPGREGDALVRGAVRGQEREGGRPVQGQVAALRRAAGRLRGRPALPGGARVPGGRLPPRHPRLGHRRLQAGLHRAPRRRRQDRAGRHGRAGLRVGQRGGRPHDDGRPAPSCAR